MANQKKNRNPKGKPSKYILESDIESAIIYLDKQQQADVTSCAPPKAAFLLGTDRKHKYFEISKDNALKSCRFPNQKLGLTPIRQSVRV